MSLKKLNYLGLFSGLIAALGWATLGLWLKNIQLDYYSITVIRFLFSGLLFVVFVLVAFIFRKKIKFEKKSLLKASALGILLFTHILSVIFTYKNLSIGEATVLTNLHLFFIILFSLPWLLKNGKLPHFLIGNILLCLGIYIIFKEKFEFELLGIISGVTSSFLFATYSYLSNKLLKTEANKYLGVMFIAGGIFGLVFSGKIPIDTIDQNEALNLLLLCSLSTFLPLYAFLHSVKSIGTLGASVLSYFTILFGVLIEIFVSKEVNTNQIGGALIVFASLIFLLFVHQRTQNPPAPQQ
jgi:drug/metabolite transporter (DMT)-like permease